MQGYLQFWDDLLKRNPGLWIDSCASGGRPNDMETMQRSVPLHYTHYGYGNHPVKLSFHHTLFEWLPYFKEVTLSWDVASPGRYDRQVDSFSYHCGLGPMIIPCIDIRKDDYDYDLMKRMLGIWQRAAEMMLGGTEAWLNANRINPNVLFTLRVKPDLEYQCPLEVSCRMALHTEREEYGGHNRFIPGNFTPVCTHGDEKCDRHDLFLQP